MSRIDPSDVVGIAALARLALTDTEVQAMARHLELILEYVASLDSLDTTGVEPTAHGFDFEMPSRPDRAEPPLDPEVAVSNAPQRQASAFLVPKMLEQES